MRALCIAALIVPLLCIPARAQIVANTVSGNNGSGVVTTTAINTTGATAIWVFVGTTIRHACTDFTITDNKSNAFVSSGFEAFDVGGGIVMSSCWLYASGTPTLGTGHTFTATATGYITIRVVAVNGTLSAAASIDQHVEAFTNNTNTTPIQLGSIHPTQNGELILSAINEYNPGADTYAINGSFTLLQHANGTGLAGGLAYLVQTTAGATNPTWQHNDTGYSTSGNVISLKAIGGGGPASARRRVLN